jgi:hypothetical protein
MLNPDDARGDGRVGKLRGVSRPTDERSRAVEDEEEYGEVRRSVLKLEVP